MIRNALLAIAWASFAAILVASTGCGGGGKDKTGKQPKQDVAQDKGPDKGSGKIETRKPDFTTTAEDFSKEFIAEENAAKSKYADKVVELTGEVSSVAVYEGGKSAAVQLKGAKKDPKDIVGTLVQGPVVGEAVQKALQLSRKQKVKLTGPFSGSFSIVINLDKCALEELGKSDVISISAEDLAKEFTKDAKDAEMKYQDKDLLLTGHVEEKTERDGFHFAKLKGDGKLRVSVTVGAEDKGLLKAGETMRFRIELPYPPRVDKGEVSLDAGRVVGAK